MASLIDRPQLRKLLIDTLRTDGDFTPFVLDYFPNVHRNFTGGMDRTSKLNLLLESVDGDDILRVLIKLEPELAARLHIAAASAPAAPNMTPTPIEKPSPASIDPVSLSASSASLPPPKYVLHLSDLHFSEDTEADQWHTQLLLDLRDQMQIRELSAVVISGDITNHATVEQFGFARNFLQQLCESFCIRKQRLIIVPGNHDVNWTLTDHGQDGFSPFAMFHQQLTGTAYPPSAAAQTTLLHLADLKLLVLGLNSAWKIDRAHPSRAGLHAGAFGKALGSLLKNEEYQKCNKLAVWHHPPAELTAKAGLDGAVLEQLAQAGFRLILHGHIHRSDNALFRYYRQSSVGGLEILTAGTFGAPTHELVSGYPFQYQVLEFRGDILTVHTRKRETVAGGWMADYRWPRTAGQGLDSSYQVRLEQSILDTGETERPKYTFNRISANRQTHSTTLSTNSPAASLVGTTIAQKYSLIELIGEGGTGAAYFARDNALGRNVCLKVFYHIPVARKAEVMASTELSVRAVSGIVHRNVYQVYDFGWIDKNDMASAYIACEYIRGNNLSHIDIDEIDIENSLGRQRRTSQLQRFWRSVSDAFLMHSPDAETSNLQKRLNIAGQIVDGLIAAQAVRFAGIDGFEQRGICHGDITPSNIMFDTQMRRIVLVDFMFPDIQRLLFRNGNYWTREDNTYRFQPPRTAAFGTPGFMPPEQARDGLVTVQSDIYTLGLSFVWIIFGNLINNSNDSYSVADFISMWQSGFRYSKSGINDKHYFVYSTIEHFLEGMTKTQPTERVQTLEEIRSFLIAVSGKVN